MSRGEGLSLSYWYLLWNAPQLHWAERLNKNKNCLPLSLDFLPHLISASFNFPRNISVGTDVSVGDVHGAHAWRLDMDSQHIHKEPGLAACDSSTKNRNRRTPVANWPASQLNPWALDLVRDWKYGGLGKKSGFHIPTSTQRRHFENRICYLKHPNSSVFVRVCVRVCTHVCVSGCEEFRAMSRRHFSTVSDSADILLLCHHTGPTESIFDRSALPIIKAHWWSKEVKGEQRVLCQTVKSP